MLTINDIYKNLRTNIPKNILSGNSKIIVGFSGGPDSRLLIDFLCRSIKNPEKNIIATHVNYKFFMIISYKWTICHYFRVGLRQNEGQIWDIPGLE